MNPGDGDMSQVLVDDRSHPERHMTILAPEGRFDTDTERGELVFLLEDGKIYTTDKKGSSVLAFDEYKVRLPLDSLFKSLVLRVLQPDVAWVQYGRVRGHPPLHRVVGPEHPVPMPRHLRAMADGA